MRARFNRFKSALVLLPTAVVVFYFIWGFSAYTVYLAFTSSTFLPVHDWVGLDNFRALLHEDRWWTAYANLFIFGGLYMLGCIALGVGLAVLLDRIVKAESVLRSIYLYPMSISLVITGLTWQWMLNTTSGLPQLLHQAQLTPAALDILGSPSLAIYAVALAAIWHGTGLIMILFLATIKGADPEIWKAAKIDQIPVWRVYWSILLPQMRPTLLTAIMLLGFQVVRSFDVVVVMTGGGPGYASDLPARYVFEYFFERSQIGQAAAAAVWMVMTMLLFIVPYLFFELRRRDR